MQTPKVLPNPILVNGFPKAGTNLLKSVLSLTPNLRLKQRWPTFAIGNPVRRRLEDLLVWFDKALNRDILFYGVDWPREMSNLTVRLVLASLRPGEYMQAHIPYSHGFANLIRREGICLLVMLRDPRDIVVSHYKYVMKMKNHFLHEIYSKLPSDDQRLMTSIVGIEQTKAGQPMLLNIHERVCGMLKWEESFPGQTVLFENLVGPKGGGDRERQLSELQKIFDVISIPMNEGRMKHIADNFFGIGTTFRKGQISGWKQEFNNQHRKLFKSVTGDLLQRLGYECEDRW